MSRPDRGSFEELVEHNGDRTVPIQRPRLRAVMLPSRGERIKHKLWIAAPYLMLLAGLGCLSVSVWPQLLPTVGCALFALSTVWSLVRCVR